MFYEESQINDILKCLYCENKFDEPRILPCEKTVCNACLEKMVMSVNKKDNCFKCSLCQETHKNGEFPISESLKELLNISPDKVYRRDLVEKLISNLKDIETLKVDLEYSLSNSVDMVKEHCIECRCDVDLATETAILDIQKHRDMIIQQIDEYELKAIEAIQIDQKANEEFEKKISELDMFSKHHGYDLNYFTNIILSDIITSIFKNSLIEISLNGDGSFYIIYLDVHKYLNQVTVDRNKKIISSKTGNGKFFNFKKNKDTIVEKVNGSCPTNLDQNLSIVKQYTGDFSNNVLLFSISEAYIYCFCQRRRVKIMRIYTKELEFIKVIGQYSIPTGAFYIPFGIKQFECKNGKNISGLTKQIFKY